VNYWIFCFQAEDEELGQLCWGAFKNKSVAPHLGVPVREALDRQRIC
jgi:hypothetical protein